MPNVLIVDDGPELAGLVRHHLEPEGFTTILAGDAEEAWEALGRAKPAAAIVDLRLPGKDGWWLAERIRSDSRFAHLPVIILTSMVEPEVIERAGSLGCEYLGKAGFSASALITKLRSAIEKAPEPSRGNGQVEVRPTQVVMLLPEYRISGRVGLAPEFPQFAAAWESLIHDARAHITVEDATISSPDGRAVISTVPTMEIAKGDIRAAFPGE